VSHTITIRGQRDLWLEFVHKTKKEKKTVWEALRPFLTKYVRADDQRLLLLLLPNNLTEQLTKEDDPERYIQEAIQERLERK